MNNHKNILLSLLLIAVSLTGCFDDKGNYNYVELDRVTEITGIDESYTMVKYSTELEIDPELVFKYDETDESQLEYQWILLYTTSTIDGTNNYMDTISTEKNLKLTIDDPNIPFGVIDLWYNVRNIETGIEYKESSKIRVVNPFTEGDYFLYKNGENAELLIINTNDELITDVYYKITSLVIPGNPLKMGEMTISSLQNDLIIYTDKAPGYGAILDVTNFAYKGDASITFNDGVPAELDLKDFRTTLVPGIFNDAKYLIGGNYYYFYSVVSSSYKPLINLSVPTLENIDQMSYLPEDKMVVHQESTGFVFYSNSRGGANYYAVNSLGLSGSFPAINLSYPGKCLFIGKEAGSSPYDIRLMMENEGSLQEYILNVTESTTGQSWSILNASGNTPIAKELNWLHLIEENTLWAESHVTRYFFFTKGNKVYRYNYGSASEDNIPQEWITLPEGSEIAYMRIDLGVDEDLQDYDKQIVIAANQKNAENSGSIYYYSVDGELIKAYENVCGEITDRINRSLN